MDRRYEYPNPGDKGLFVQHYAFYQSGVRKYSWRLIEDRGIKKKIILQAKENYASLRESEISLNRLHGMLEDLLLQRREKKMKEEEGWRSFYLDG